MRTHSTFFDVQKKIKYEKSDMRWATKLYTAVAAMSVLAKTPNLDDWADEFRLLRKTVPAPTIECTLEWYTKNIRTPYAPKAFSAAGFRTKFAAMQNQMAKSEDVTDASTAISRRLALIWPGEEKRDELRFIHVSLENYKDISKKMIKSFGTNKIPNGFASYFINSSGDPDSFVAYWLRRVHIASTTEDDWDGRLLKHTVAYDSMRFIRYLNQMCFRWNGKTNQGPAILKAINEDC